MIGAPLEFIFDFEDDYTETDLNNLYRNCQKANQAIDNLVKGKLSFDDALALCETANLDADQVIDDLANNLEFLGFL